MKNPSLWKRFFAHLLRSEMRKPTKGRRARLEVEELEPRITPDTAAFGPNGIDAQGLPLGFGGIVLNGATVPIGQVEIARPAMSSLDPNVYHPHVSPTGVFLECGNASANGGADQLEIRRDDGHATPVAGAIIGDGPGANEKGVAPGAALWSSSNLANRGIPFLLAAQKVARPTAGVFTEAVNVSYMLNSPTSPPDGNFLHSLAVDWMGGAGQTSGQVGYDTLFVYASGNAIARGAPSLLTASYNGLVVGSTTRPPGERVFRKIDGDWSDFRMAAADRRLIDLVAPGVDIRLPRLGGPTDAAYGNYDGSSFAAPQATGAVALLAQYGLFWFATANDGHWNGDALEPLVMKAVLMNSADKVRDRLGMQKTILKTDGTNWDNSDAVDIPGTEAQTTSRQRLPLDLQMGTGQLNVRRALSQYDKGEYHPVADGTLPTQAWDYNSIITPNSTKVYRLPSLAQGSYVAITLAWNRMVTLRKHPDNEAEGYQQGDTFQAAQLANLDLEILDRTTNTVVWKSQSTTQNLEHIFFQIQNNDEYSIVVRQVGNQGASYGLAWWAEAGRQGDGKVEGTAWRDGNQNGLWGTGEAGIAGVYADLYSSAGVWLDSTTTDSNGQYQFANLDPGDYYVRFTDPQAFNFTGQHFGTNEAIDSDPDANGQTDAFTITDDESVTMDAGFVPLPTGSVSGKVWNDTDSDGIQDTGEAAREGVTVDLYDSSDNLIDSTATDEDGVYEFNWLTADDYYVTFGAPVNYGFTTKDAGSDDTVDSDAGASGSTSTFTLSTDQQKEHVDAGLVVTQSSVQGYVWNDADSDGIKDDGEYSVPEAEVKLYDSSNQLVATTITDNGGHYEFDQLDSGTYYATFTKPYNFASFSPQNQGSDDTVDSDVNSSGHSSNFTLGSTEIKTHLDAGLIEVEYGSVSGSVWQDNNGNGLQNSGEPYLPGIFVELFDSSDNWVEATMTDADGNYLFTGVVPGDYYVTFDVPTGYSFTTKGVGSNHAIDSDANSSGATDTVTVSSAGEITHLDAGIVVPAISALSRTSGPTGGMYAVTITGVGFTGATAVKFGTTYALSFTVTSDTLIMAWAPMHARGIVDVTVTTSAGTSATSSADQFAFVNGAPTGGDNIIWGMENTDYTFTTSDFHFSDFSDMPPDGFLAVKITTLPSVGTLLLNGNAVSAGDFISVSDIYAGKLKFRPAANTYGNNYTSFTFQVQDNGGTAYGGLDLDPIAKTITFNVMQGL